MVATFEHFLELGVRAVLREIAFAEFLGGARGGYEGNVGEAGKFVAECFMNEHLHWHVGKVFLGTDDVGDFHLAIIDNGREVVERRAIGTHDDRIGEKIRVPLDVAAHGVVDGDRPVLIAGNKKSNDVRATFGEVIGDLVGSEIKRPADIAVGTFFLLGGLAISLDDFRRVEVAKGLILRDQAIAGGLVEVIALGLEVRTKLAADLGAFVPIEP